MMLDKYFSCFHLVAFVLFYVCSIFGTTTWAKITPSSNITLENQFIALAIDKQTGSVISIHDKMLDVTYKMKGICFSLTTDRGTLHSTVAAGVKKSDETATFSFDTKDFDISLYYRLGSNDKFIEKWLEIKAKDARPCFIQEVVLEDVKLSTQFKEIHYHDDQTIWHCPINLFLRGEKGGCFAGIEYPYWKLDIVKHSGFSLGFAPNYQVSAGETFVSEKYFLGLFRNEGIHRVSQGPYPGRGRFSFVNFSPGLSIANYCMIGQAYPQFAAKENRDFFMKWRAWATKNLDYLTVKRDLFDSPGNSPLDGSAHIIKDRGFLFLFRGGFDANRNQNTALRASIPVNRWIQLEENPKAIYQIKEIYPRQGKVHATVRYGDSFLFDMPNDPAVVFEIKPTPNGSKIFQAVTGAAEKGRQVLSAFTSTKTK